MSFTHFQHGKEKTTDDMIQQVKDLKVGTFLVYTVWTLTRV